MNYFIEYCSLDISVEKNSQNQRCFRFRKLAKVALNVLCQDEIASYKKYPFLLKAESKYISQGDFLYKLLELNGGTILLSELVSKYHELHGSELTIPLDEFLFVES